MQIPAQRYLLFALLVVGGALTDLATKSWVFAWRGMPDPLQDTYWLIERVLGITTSLNQGALFGIGQGQVILFVSMSVVATVGILYFLFVHEAARDGLLTVSMGCVLAGILGNLYDRLGLPGLHWNQPFNNNQVGDPVFAVRDWIHFRFPIIHYDWPIFNIADSLLVCGAGLLMWHSWRIEAPAQVTASSTSDETASPLDSAPNEVRESV